MSGVKLLKGKMKTKKLQKENEYKKAQKVPEPFVLPLQMFANDKTIHFFGFYGNKTNEMKRAIAVAGRSTTMPSHALCLFLCIPLFDCKMRTLIVVPPLLGKSCLKSSRK